MIKLLKEISKRIILLNEIDLTDEQTQSGWVGQTPATDEDIRKAEEFLQLKLPSDYIEFLKVTNGFPASNRGTGITFSPIDKVDYLTNVDEDLIEIWSGQDALKETNRALSESILVGGLGEEQYFLLIPPNNTHREWRYWEFAAWIPGEWEFKTLKDYFKQELVSLKEDTKGLRKPKAKPIIDYGLRDSLFNADWQSAYENAFDFLRFDKRYNYFQDERDLLKILLVASAMLNRYDILVKDLELLKSNKQDNGLIMHHIERFQEAAKQRKMFIEEMDAQKFVPRINAVTKDEIEEQTKRVRFDLMKPKNLKDKVEYQLHFFFDYGNREEFIGLYSAYADLPLFFSHLKAAIVYATFSQTEEAKKALLGYFETTKNYRPLEPFLTSSLIDIMDEQFSKDALQILK